MICQELIGFWQSYTINDNNKLQVTAVNCAESIGDVAGVFLKVDTDANLVCIFVNDIIESQKKQSAWVAELVDARDLKSLGA